MISLHKDENLNKETLMLLRYCPCSIHHMKETQALYRLFSLIYYLSSLEQETTCIFISHKGSAEVAHPRDVFNAMSCISFQLAVFPV